MATDFDDFVDRDYAASQKTAVTTGHSAPIAARPPTREELEAQMAETQQRLADLRQAQERLERERAALEEARRRRVELQTGREEMVHHLTRGIGLLEEAAFAAQRDAEQMSRTLEAFREAVAKVQAINEETWSQEHWQVELTRALTTIDNARMEWNAARLKWTLLDGAEKGGDPKPAPASPAGLTELNWIQLCRLGVALTWPLVAVALAALVVFGIALFRS